MKGGTMSNDKNVRFMLCRYSDEIKKVTVLRETPKRVYISGQYSSTDIVRKDAAGKPIRSMFETWELAHAALVDRTNEQIVLTQQELVERKRALAKVRRMKKGTVEK